LPDVTYLGRWLM